MQLSEHIHNGDLKQFLYDEFVRICIKSCSNEPDAEGNIKYFENSDWKKISDLFLEILEELFCECAQFSRKRETQISFLRWTLFKLNGMEREIRTEAEQE